MRGAITRHAFVPSKSSARSCPGPEDLSFAGARLTLRFLARSTSLATRRSAQVAAWVWTLSRLSPLNVLDRPQPCPRAWTSMVTGVEAPPRTFTEAPRPTHGWRGRVAHERRRFEAPAAAGAAAAGASAAVPGAAAGAAFRAAARRASSADRSAALIISQRSGETKPNCSRSIFHRAARFSARAPVPAPAAGAAASGLGAWDSASANFNADRRPVRRAAPLAVGGSVAATGGVGGAGGVGGVGSGASSAGAAQACMRRLASASSSRSCLVSSSIFPGSAVAAAAVGAVSAAGSAAAPDGAFSAAGGGVPCSRAIFRIARSGSSLSTWPWASGRRTP